MTTQRSTRRMVWWVLGMVAMAAGAFLLGGRGPQAPEAADETAEPVNTAQVVQGNLTREETFDGTLEKLEGTTIASPSAGVVTHAASVGDTVAPGSVLFEVDGEPVVVLAGSVPAYRDLTLGTDALQLATRMSGTLTWVAPIGSVLEQGDVVATVDEQPIVLLYGEVPAYRGMFDARTNLEGADILQLEVALDALGYNPDGDIEVDGEYTAATANLVKAWQADIGALEDGVVDLGEVVFLPGPAQVTAELATVGARVGDGATLMSVTTGDPVAGADVLQLEQALVQLGLADSADEVFDSGTASAIRLLQESTGGTQTGFLTASSLMFSTSTVRVDSVTAGVGSRVPANGAVMDVSNAELVVRMDLPASDQGALRAGDAVVVELPDGNSIGATVESVATVATRVQGAEATFEVIVVLDDPGQAAEFEDAPVDVEAVTESVTDVLSVPVTALLALAEGGYAVEVYEGGQTRLVGVEPGFFAGGMVEVTGDLSAGDSVVVP